jgi:hypothetical protein
MTKPFNLAAFADKVTSTGKANPSALVDIQNTSTGSISLPVGTTAQRNASPVDGMTRLNTSTDSIEVYYNGSWTSIVTFVLNDAYWKYVSLLLTANSSTPSTFITDASTNNHALTIVGDTKPNNFNPYTPGYYSNYFTSTNALTVPDNTAWDMNTDITVEAFCWLESYNTTDQYYIVSQVASGQRAWAFGVNNGTLQVYYTTNGSTDSFVTSSSFTVTAGRWYHFAFTRTSAGVYTFYVDGVATGSTTNTATIFTSNQPLTIGNFGNFGISTLGWKGYISNLRFVRGTVVYTGNFTPSTTPLTAITNTQLLTCQSNRFIDNSVNNLTFTVYGAVKVNSFDPFSPNSNYSTYGSGYFDGTGDWLSIPYSTAFDYGTGNFTMEAWVYLTATPATGVPIIGAMTSGGTDWQFYSSTQLALGSDAIAWRFISNSTTFPLNTWMHLAVSRASGVAYMWLNGQSIGSGTETTSFNAQSGTVYIGRSGDGAFNGGYISDVRILKGVGLYTSAFTPPASQLTAISGTSLLTLQNNKSINNNVFLDNSTNNFAITRVGNTTQGTFGPYGENWSNYFDGTGDNLLLSYNSAFHLSGDFTIEMWVYPTNVSTSMLLNFAGGLNIAYASYEIVWDGTYVNFAASSTNASYNIGSETGTTGRIGSPNLNKWNHIAVTRSGNVYRGFLNGVQGYTQTLALTPYNPNARGLAIGGNYATTWGSGTPTTVLNGYISDLRIVKGTAVYTSDFTPPTTPLQPIVNTSLLTCQSNKFIDNSPNNFAITKNGDTKIQNFSPFGPKLLSTRYYSNYFDGSGDYLQVANGTTNQMGTGDWTAEAWIYVTTTSSINPIISKGGSTTDWFLGTYTNGRLYFGIGVTDYFSGSGPVVTINTWNHVALVRSGTSLSTYLNGVLGNTQTGISQNFASTGALNIGRGRDTSTNYLTGYISDARLVKGTAVYTSNFTPPTAPLSAVSNTVLLTCQSNTVKDNSTTASTITVNGDTKTTTVSPFTLSYATQQGYSDSVYSGSAYFDGTGDYVLTATNPALDLPGDFTIECWINPTALSSNRVILDRWTSGNAGGWQIYWRATGTSLTFYVNASIVMQDSNASRMITNAWQHIAITRSGTTGYMFINGQLAATASGFSTALSSSLPLAVGIQYSTLTNDYNGYISDVRIVKGTALYTSSFVPQNTPLTAITNTTALLNFTNAGIRDKSMDNNVETIGDVSLSTAQKKYNTSSIRFDGTGDWIHLPAGPQYEFGGGDFTIEFWFYTSSTSRQWFIHAATDYWFGLDYNAVGTNKLGLWASGNGTGWNLINSDAGGNGICATTLPQNQWNHIAVTRNGNNWRVFLNGTQDLLISVSGSIVNRSTEQKVIGSWAISAHQYPVNGYIDDFRITKGYARYTSNFTVPETTPLNY